MQKKKKIEEVLPKCKSTESITHNSAKFRNVFIRFQVFHTTTSNSRRRESREVGETSDRSVNGCFLY